MPHFKYLISSISRWSNLLRSIAGTWWGSHPSSLLLIFKALIRSKVDYGSFLYASASTVHRKKINSLLAACLRTIIGAVYSTPNMSLEVECVCPPIEIRSRYLAYKFLLKQISSPAKLIFHCFHSLSSLWRYVPKTLPLLASISTTLIPYLNSIITSINRLPIYDIPFHALTHFPKIHFNHLFLSYSKPQLQSLPINFVNYLFDELISSRFANYCLIFTDGSVYTNSAGFSFFIPSLNINFSDNLPSKACSFTTESYAISSALEFVKSLNIINILIVSDSLSVLSSLSSVPFKKSRSFLTIKIKALIYSLYLMDINVEFLWCPSHVGISGNEIADHLAKLTNSFNRPPILKIPSSDLLSSFHPTINKAWQDKWSNFSLAN
ncbi:uncharacterized protein LOC126896384 [Daktulosphaira vitifoliae]|uniref:uncharacterized protein LOC126896384 n=1 Tax=Daktulosphaira vitifoliae TaxID=58002 RepID=UPI0021AAC6C7|nr:uncharacterized protein LOC126896384 [Daktulosphaira vitifoliae]